MIQLSPFFAFFIIFSMNLPVMGAVPNEVNPCPKGKYACCMPDANSKLKDLLLTSKLACPSTGTLYCNAAPCGGEKPNPEELARLKSLKSL